MISECPINGRHNPVSAPAPRFDAFIQSVVDIIRRVAAKVGFVTADHRVGADSSIKDIAAAITVEIVVTAISKEYVVVLGTKIIVPTFRSNDVNAVRTDVQNL